MEIPKPGRLPEQAMGIRLISPDSLREYLKSAEADDKLYNDLIVPLRKDLSSNEGYSRIKNAARIELDSIHPNALRMVMQKATPYLRDLPASHSKGHVSRDLIHITELLNDPQIKQLDDVELASGIFGGIFHDIGNSIAPRYEEHRRLAAHAEVGAYLFGFLADKILPPNLTKLIQYSIAAHTNHAERRVHKNGKEYLLEPYNDDVVGQDRMGMWLTRASDRTEIISIIQVARVIVAHAQPIVDYYVNPSDYEPLSPQEEFACRYSLAENEEKSLLNELQSRINSAKSTDRNRYNRFDTPFMSEQVFKINSADLQSFIDKVKKPKADKLLDRESAFHSLLGICRLLEPGIDIDEKLALLSDKFINLDDTVQVQWLNGANLLINNLYTGHYSRMRSRIIEDQKFKQQRSPFINGLVSHIRRVSLSVLDAINPKYITDPSKAPDVIDALIV